MSGVEELSKRATESGLSEKRSPGRETEFLSGFLSHSSVLSTASWFCLLFQSRGN